MTRLALVVTIAVSTLLLAGMMLTNPDYNRAVRPFETRVPPGESGQTRLIAGRIEGWRTADSIALTTYGQTHRRDTQGVFLIVDLALSGTTQSTMLRAAWIGASGRRYDTTARVTGIMRQIQDLWLQPGLTSKTVAIFELPPDEVAQGSILLSDRIMTPLDGTLRLSAPHEPPTHEALARFDG